MNTIKNGKEWTGVYVDGKKINGIVKNKTIFYKQKSNNLLKLLKENAEYVAFEGNEVSIKFNEDNTITINAFGVGDWGLNINQPTLTLKAGKTYKLSCNDIYDGTWISINNDSSQMLNSGILEREFTINSDINSPKIVIWVNSEVIYNNITWNIKLIEI